MPQPLTVISTGLSNLLITTGVGLTYFYYHYQLFSYTGVLTKRTPPFWQTRIIAAFLNFMIFVVLSAFNSYLIVNWIVFAVVLVLETWILYRASPVMNLFCGLQGATVGLAVNLCTRSVMALLLNVPLFAFDSRTWGDEILTNLKRYPIAAGFLLSGLLFRVFRTYHNRSNREKSQVPVPELTAFFVQNRKFATRLLAAMFCYLVLNLLIYSAPVNEPMLKLWGLKSGLCVLVGFAIVVYYVDELNRLKLFEYRGNAMREELNRKKAVEKELEAIACRDCLTGCHSREYGRRALETAVSSGEAFCLCFVDLNFLKPVNDELGHDMGDRYLSAVTFTLQTTVRNDIDTLCRYGGDEFLLIFPGRTPETAEDQMHNAAQALFELSNSSEYPFTMSISYGIVSSEEAPDPETLIRIADERMYRQKQRLKCERKNADPERAN